MHVYCSKCEGEAHMHLKQKTCYAYLEGELIRVWHIIKCVLA